MSDTPDRDGISIKNGSGIVSLVNNIFNKTVRAKPSYLKGNLFINKTLREFMLLQQTVFCDTKDGLL